MRAAIGNQCRLIKRGVTFFILSYILFGSLKINLAAAFWINCKGLIELAGRPDIIHTYKKNKKRNPRNPVLKLQPPVLHEYPTHNNSLIEHADSFSASRRRFRTVSAVTAEHKAEQHWTLKRAALLFIYSFLKFNRHIKLHRDSGLYPNLRPLEIIIKTI